MTVPLRSVLCLNGGSSSVRFAWYGLDGSPKALLRGKVDRIGLQNTTITFEDFRREQKGSDVIGDFDHALAGNFLVKWIEEQLVVGSVSAIGHRIVNRAADAVMLFCYQVKKFIGAYSAALGGLDTLIFTGGVGENEPAARERICSGLDFLGISLEKSRNDSNAKIISAEGARVAVHVIRTDEELRIAKATGRIFNRNRSH